MEAFKNMEKPTLVSGTDGVGTKLKVAFLMDKHDTVGIDCVAMCVNDIACAGGEPLFFLDYIACGKNIPEKIATIVSGVAEGCRQSGAALIGGETAEMPGVVPESIVELSGFCIGCCEKSKLIDPKTVQPGDVFIGYKSDSFHANGWSLIRRILEENPDVVDEEELRSLLQPTRLYHDVVEDMRRFNVTPKAYAHITGGGLPENLERFLGDYGADLSIPYWDNTAAQKILKHVDTQDRFNTFNMGIGWVAIVRPEDAEAALKAGPGGTVIGTLREGRGIHVKVQGE